MKNIVLIFTFLAASISVSAQVMTPEMLWQLNRVGVIGLSNDGSEVIFKVTNQYCHLKVKA